MYVNQPNPGSNDQWTTGLNSNIGQRFITPGEEVLNVGHTFVGFTKYNADGTSVTQVMGFYPDPNASSVKSIGAIKDDSGHPYNVSYSSNVSAAQFGLALESVSSDSNGTLYNLASYIVGGKQYNCTDAAIAWMSNAGVSLPNGVSRGLFINTPGDYGQVLSKFNGAKANSGQAPQGHGTCN